MTPFYSPPGRREVYTFVDGGYLQPVYEKHMTELFNKDGQLDVKKVCSGTSARKLFYYDAIDYEKHPNENEEAKMSRIEKKEEELKRIERIDSVHVKRGEVRTGKKKREQKKVDVMLSTDALKFAHIGAMQEVVLLAGDLDFQPLVESLVLFGIYVTVYADPRDAAEELIRSADSFRELNVDLLHGWSSDEFQKIHPRPHSVSQNDIPREWKNTGTQGNAGGSQASLLHREDTGEWIVMREAPEGKIFCICRDRETLERYIKIRFGSLRWNQ